MQRARRKIEIEHESSAKSRQCSLVVLWNQVLSVDKIWQWKCNIKTIIWHGKEYVHLESNQEALSSMTLEDYVIWFLSLIFSLPVFFLYSLVQFVSLLSVSISPVLLFLSLSPGLYILRIYRMSLVKNIVTIRFVCCQTIVLLKLLNARNTHNILHI